MHSKRMIQRIAAVLLLMGLLVLPVQAASINVNTTTVSFGTAQAGVPKMSLIPIRVTRDTTGYNPFTIRVYTRNPNGQAGMYGDISPGFNLGLKCWCANFGGGTGPGGMLPPDPAVGTNATDWWLRIPDESEMDPGNVYTWRRLEMTGAELAPTPVGTFEVWFALDVRATTPAESYRTDNLVFEIINQ